ncbi:ComEA family DNA-binding protein [Alkalinema sp. FACHB-956]|uniref:ComEA family DNA-binding protein n=1 Tax=Alkalinema sp. FACHB-956 TaxID=2692768 RepID=UPI001683F762|nr:ComEA family DNA-binding protein [Alkalinema sp. FACHB-956]MBD2329732.1 ComEA family DNA-binding protein [Alkalinema sp. FACHB-956]
MALLDWLNLWNGILGGRNGLGGNRPALPWQSLKAKIANDPYYRFHTLEEIKLAASLGIQIDVNMAGVDDWLRLPGVSIHQARSLTQLVESGVQFYSLDDLAAALGLPVTRLQPVAPILRFCYYEMDSLDRIERLDPNSATIETLQRLPGVGPVLARAIVRHRTSHGRYRSLVDMQQRLNLPGQTTAKLMHYLKF